jgi:hypothetical protein
MMIDKVSWNRRRFHKPTARYRLTALIFSAILLAFTVSSPAQPVQPHCESTSICPGEDLIYEVRWMGLSLGRIRLRTSPSILDRGSVIHSASARIDSYDGLPFVDVHAVDSTWMDTGLFSDRYRNYEKKSDGWFTEQLRVDSTRRFVTIESYLADSVGGPPLKPPAVDTIALDGNPIQNGLSILFFAREEVRKTRRGVGIRKDEVVPGKGENGEMRRRVSVPTVIYGKKGTTHFLFGSVPEYTEVDAMKDRKVRVMPFHGTAEFKGLFGLTGEFRGWCTDDNASVPVRAELQVMLGSIKVELIRYRRAGWTPPE